MMNFYKFIDEVLDGRTDIRDIDVEKLKRDDPENFSQYIKILYNFGYTIKDVLDYRSKIIDADYEEDSYKESYRWNNTSQNFRNRSSSSSYSVPPKSEPSTLKNLQLEMEDLGYYPTHQIAVETFLNLSRINNRKVGQKIHAFCLSGPPGAGKSFYVETYKKLLQERVEGQVQMISYQCHTKTTDSNLYEDVNIAAAIKGDSDKVIISGKLVQAIDIANEGKIVILFLDEYDKAGEEVDTFLLNFLQEGTIDTTQRGKVSLKSQYSKNLQVFLCKNDAREKLSGPLERRLKFLELDYMTPDNLSKTVNRKLEYVDSSLRDAVVLLYTAMYSTLPGKHQNESDREFEFSRLPAASECMQAIEDAWELMSIGADQSDIVLDGIVSNMVKTKEDLEQFQLLTKSRNDLIIWYNKLMEAVSNNNENFLNKVKEEMARQFFPSEIKRATRNIEEEVQRKKRELEKSYHQQKKDLQQKIDESQKQLDKYQKNIKEFQNREKELERLEKEVNTLRQNAQKDAKEGAEKYIRIKEKELEEKTKQLEKEMAEVQMLRETAREDAERIANEKIAQKKAEVQALIEQTNNEIIRHNINLADFQNLQGVIASNEEELKRYKKFIEKVLGRTIRDDELYETNDETISTVGSGEFQQSQVDNGIIQSNIIFNESNSIFDVAQDGTWIDIGEIVLENRQDENVIFNSDLLRKLIERYATNGKYKDGIVIYNGSKIKIIAVRYIQEEKDKQDGSKYKNKFKIYTTSTIIPKYAFLDICNFIKALNPDGGYVPNSIDVNGKKCRINFGKVINASLECMLYTTEDYQKESGSSYTMTKQDAECYLFSYKNTQHKNLKDIATEVYSITKCSKKDVPLSKIQECENMAYLRHSQNIGVTGFINKLPDIDERG